VDREPGDYKPAQNAYASVISPLELDTASIRGLMEWMVEKAP
jgi:hypothetical protein